MRAFSSSFCISIFILFSYSERFSRISTCPSNPVAAAKFLDEQPKMGPENMYGSNSHPFPEPNTQHWGLPQSVNDGSSMINNFTSYPTQGQPLTGFESQGQNHNISTSHPSANMPSMPAQNHNLNTSHPSANMPSMPAQNHNPNTSHPSANMPSMPAQIHNLNTSHPSANMPNMHSPLYGPYGPLPNGEPNLMDFSGNHGSTLKSGLPPTRPQATQAFSNHQTPGRNPFSPSSLQAQGVPQFPPYQWPSQPVQQPLLPPPNRAGQNVPSIMIYQDPYHPPLAPAGPALPADYPQTPLESQKAPGREKRAREESDSEEPPPKKRKGGKRPRVKEPPPAYNRRYPRPPSWGEASDGSPLFVYNDDGELRTDRKYTAEEIRNYIDNNPRKLRIWVQQSPTQVAHRLGNRNTCMWKGCIKQGHKIDTGFFRIAFDEFYKQSKRGHRDPLRPAAVMHMWCYEQCFDPLVDYHHCKLKADKRPLTKETRNMIGIANKGKHIVRDAFKPWLKNTEFTERAREYTGSLSSALNEYHLSTRSSRKLALAHEKSKKTGECIINFHKGDLMLFCQDTGKNKQNMKQKDLPVNKFQFRPRPERLRTISVDEDSDSSDSECETYAAQGEAVAQPEEPSNALKPLGEKSLNSQIPAAGVGARPEAYGAENIELKGSVGDVVQDGKIREITCENPPSDEFKPLEFGIPTELEFYPGAGKSSDPLSPLTEFLRGGTTNFTEEQDDLFGDMLGDQGTSMFEDQPPFEWSAPEEQPELEELPKLKVPEPKVPEPKVPEPKVPEPKKWSVLKLPVPIEKPKKSPSVEDLSGSRGSQVAEAGPR